MALVPLELPLQSEPGRYAADGAARLINAYPEGVGRSGKIQFPLYASDGYSEFATLTGGGATRGFAVVGNYLYAVSGRQVFKVDISGTATAIGGIPNDGPVIMAANQKASPQIMFVGVGVYGLIDSDTVIPITDSDLSPPNSVAFLNQRFVTTSPNGRFQWSALSEGATWGPLDFATAEYAADGLERAFVRSGELLLFGERTIEPWYNPASGDDVFAKSGAVIEQGCLNGHTVARIENVPIFVSDDRTVRVLEGYAARRVSNHSVERSIRDTADPAAMSGFSYQKDGHSFYCLRGSDFSWTFDATTQQWHERQSYGMPRWCAEHYAKFGDRHIVGSCDTNKLYRLDAGVFDESGAHLVMEVHVPVHAYPRKIQLNELRIDMIPGVGLNSSDEHNANPKVMVALSKDAGVTFGNERELPIGRRGNRSAEVKGFRWGVSNEDGFVIRIRVSAAVARAITGIFGDFDVLAH